MWVVGVLMKPANSRERYEVIAWDGCSWWLAWDGPTREWARGVRERWGVPKRLGLIIKIWDRKKREFIT